MAEVTVINQELLKKNGMQRVCAYCRVSRSTSDQLNSYASQIRVYTEMIKKNPEWEMVEIFADEGITGTSACKRPEFLRMISMCEHHKIDRIITKSVSRFARNVKEALEYVRKLKILGVGVQFEKEGIYTLSMGDEMLLNTFAAIAEEESVEIAIRLRNANKKRMADGDFIDGHAPYGFRLEYKKLTEYPPEAETVRRIFSDYLSGRSTHEIARLLNETGIPSPENSTWNAAAIRYILKNEKYKGDYLCQKTFHTDILPFKQKRNYGDEDQFYIVGSHKGIIPVEDFDKANEIMASRRDKLKAEYGNTEYTFTKKIFCSECGSAYNRKKSNGGIYWACAKHIESRDICPSHYIREERIQDAFITMTNKLCFSGADVIAKTIAMLDTAIEYGKRGNPKAMNVSRQIADLTSCLLMLEQLNSKGYLATDIYMAQSHELTSKIANLKGQRGEMLSTMLSDRLSEIKALDANLKKRRSPALNFDKDLFCETVSQMRIDKDANIEFTLKGGLKFTEAL